jgi:hypothetical protein
MIMIAAAITGTALNQLTTYLPYASLNTEGPA